MMNFVLTRFVAALKLLDQEIGVCQEGKFRMRGAGFSEDMVRIENNLKFIAVVCAEMGLESSDNRLERIATLSRTGPLNHQIVQTELIVLRECIEDDIRFERFYHYPKKLAEIPIRVAADWAPTLAAFPGAEMKFEIESGVDCYALGHHTAAIFHFMRVVEYGLRATARKLRVTLPRGKPIEWSEWKHVIDAISKKIETTKQTKRGARKAADLEFYSGVLNHFQGFKDMYRDSVMHVRREYKDWEAEMAMRHVRDFVNKLSTRVRAA